MNEDYAIVVGISQYPRLSEPPDPPAHLKGPENDAEAMAAWLTAPSGGAVPAGNIKVIKSSAPLASPNETWPRPSDIEDTFVWLDKIAVANSDRGRGMTIGRRLYIYMSGHGFSPGRNLGCLFTADAAARRGSNVHATGYMNWLMDSGYFKEFVLWMDCCMNRVATMPPGPIPFQPISDPNPAGPAFIAFAAKRPLKAVESSFAEDGDKVHGLFTWSLLEGLRGAAVDRHGKVTARSLAQWTRNALKARMRQSDIDDPEVAQEPEIVQENEELILVRGLPQRTYKISLAFPSGAAGAAGRLWSGQLSPVMETFQIAAAPLERDLKPGLYVVDVPERGLRQGFEVLCPATMQISETGDAIREDSSGGLFALEVAPDNPATEIMIVDAGFGLVEKNPGRLAVTLPRGIYKVKTRLERSISERIIFLDRDGPRIQTAAIPVVAAAPIPGTASSHEYHQGAVERHVESLRNPDADSLRTRRFRSPSSSSGEAFLLVMARVWSAGRGEQSNLRPWEGVTVAGAEGEILADLELHGERHTENDPYAVFSLEVPPGVLFLRQRSKSEQGVEQSLVVPPGWRLEAYILKRDGPAGDAAPLAPRISLLMRQCDRPPGAAREDEAIETALVALADERQILGPRMEELLLLKFEDPLAGIVGGHLLVIEHERDSGRSLALLNEVIPNLRKLVGHEHPDVEALSLRCPDPSLRRIQPITAPPMFSRSWKLITEASQSQPELVPLHVWERVQAVASTPPYLVWATGGQAKADYRKELARAVWGASQTHGPGSRRSRAPDPAADLESMPALAVPESTTRGREHAPARAARHQAAQLQIPESALESLRAEYDKDQGG